MECGVFLSIKYQFVILVKISVEKQNLEYIIQYTPVTTRCSGSTGPYRDITDLCNTFSTVAAYSIIAQAMYPLHQVKLLQEA